jgi:hypothetical protein
MEDEPAIVIDAKAVFELHIRRNIIFSKLAEALGCNKQNSKNSNTNQTKYGLMLGGLANQFALGQKQYPTMLTAVVGVFPKEKGERKTQ